MSTRKDSYYLPVLIGGVKDGEILVVEPDLGEYTVERMIGTQRVGAHTYRYQTFDLIPRDSDARRQGRTWPSIGAFVHEDLDMRAATLRVLESLALAAKLKPR